MHNWFKSSGPFFFLLLPVDMFYILIYIYILNILYVILYIKNLGTVTDPSAAGWTSSNPGLQKCSPAKAINPGCVSSPTEPRQRSRCGVLAVLTCDVEMDWHAVPIGSPPISKSVPVPAFSSTALRQLRNCHTATAFCLFAPTSVAKNNIFDFWFLIFNF